MDLFVAYFRLRQNMRTKRQMKERKKLRLIIKKYQHNIREICEAINFLTSNFIPRDRKLWAHYRSRKVWENLYKNVDDHRWFEEFRLSKQQFNFICNELKQEIEPEFNPVSNKNFITTEMKVAITLYKLKSCSEYQVVGNIFGIHKSTVHFIFYEVIQAIVKILTPRYIKMPTDAEARVISENFRNICKICQILGAIDGTHIPIKAPLEGTRDLLNRKGWSSIILQAVVDDRYRFRDISCKCPGSMHDALALKKSFLYQHHAILFPKSEYHINNTSIPFFLIGDPAYPLLPWIMKDFPGQNLEESKRQFNEALNRGRVKVEQAFGMLKNKWRILLKKPDIDYKFMPQVVAACCTLYNIIMENNSTSTQNSLIDSTEEVLYQQPNTTGSRMLDTNEGALIRNLLYEEFCNGNQEI